MAAAGRHESLQPGQLREIDVSIVSILFILWFVIVMWWLMNIFSAQNRKRDRK